MRDPRKAPAGASATRLVATAYRQHGAAVFAAAAHLAGPDAAAGVTQQVFVGLVTALDRLDAWPGSMRAFLVAMAREAAVEAGTLAPPSSRRREAVVMAYFGGMTCREVAAALDESEARVRSQIRAGLKELRALRKASAGQAPGYARA